MASNVIKRMDQQNAGKVDMYELSVAMILLSEDTYAKKIDSLWAIFDMDQSNSLAFEELIVVAKTVVQAVFSLQDEDQICQLDHATELAQTLLSYYDTNADHFLAKEEFTNLFSQNHRVLQFLYNAGFLTQSDLGESHQLLNTKIPAIDSDLEEEQLGHQQQVQQTQVPQQSILNQTFSLELDRIMGFNNNLRGCVKYLNNENIIFSAGSYIVVEDIRDKNQTIFQEHSAMVVSFGLLDDQVCFSGSSDGVVLIWDIQTSQVRDRQKVAGFLRLAVSTDQERLVLLGQQKGHLLVTATSAREPKSNETSWKVNDASQVMDLVMLGDTVAVATRTHLHFLSMNKSEVQSIEQKQTIVSISHVGDKFITGSIQGQLVKWDKGKQQKSAVVSQSSINVMVNKADRRIYLACRNGQVLMLDKNLKTIRVFQLDKMGVSLLNKKIKALDESVDGDLIVALQGAQMVEIREQQNIRVIKHWHSGGRLNGIRLVGDD